METQALTTSQDDRLLQMARAQVSRPRLPNYPELKMRNSKAQAPLTDLIKGEFGLVTTVDNGENKEKKVTALGAKVPIIILKRRYSYSFYDEDTESLVAWTNELDGFTDDQVVKLADKRSGKKEIRHFTWPQFKEWKQTDLLGQKLTFKNILYVCVEEPKIERLARLIVSNASVTGVKDGEKSGDYKNPLPGSFLLFEKPISFAGSSYLEVVCELGSEWLEKNEYYLMTFANKGENTKLKETLRVFAVLSADLETRYRQDFGGDRADAIDVPGMESASIPAIDYGSDIKASDLPF